MRTHRRFLQEQAHAISRTTVGRLMPNRKSLTGPRHPDRDRQFRYIRRVHYLFRQVGLPVIGVDTKRKELIGDFANPGRR